MSAEDFDFVSWTNEAKLSETSIAKLEEEELVEKIDLLDLTSEDINQLNFNMGQTKRFIRALDKLKSSQDNPAKTELEESDVANFPEETRTEGRPAKTKTDKSTTLATISVSTQTDTLREPTKIKIAVTGRPGVGKSTFINTIRGLKPGDEGCAETGICETTAKTTRYKWKTNEDIVFCDMPAVGTLEQPSEGYISRMNLDAYDVAIIVFSGRFTEDDGMLAKFFIEEKKHVIFLRSKFDQDVDSNEKRTIGKLSSVGQVMDSMIKDARYHMKNSLPKPNPLFQNVRLFIINCEQSREHDFPQLEKYLSSLNFQTMNCKYPDIFHMNLK